MISRKRPEEGWWWWVAGVCLVVLLCVTQALAAPLPLEGPKNEGTGGQEFLHALLGIAVLFSCVTTLLACVCCKRSRGFKELGSVSSRVEGSTNTLSHGPQQEITLFPPPGVSHLSLSSTQINFEPLPDIRPRASTHPRDQQHHNNHQHASTHTPLPASFPSSPLTTLPTDQWFAEPHQNFPRGQLQYVKELGSGWFGKVLEGRASGIFSDHTKGESPPVTSTSASPPSTRVAVRALREDASQAEQAYFLHELRPYRDLTHSNVLKVLAYCLETEPFLILLQLCPKGDLKAVIQSDQSLSEAALLRMVLDAASGLEHMHSQNFIHTDLAARNCLVDEDYTVKIGDYGYNINSYKNEYYVAGDVALPLRWCAPETLRCTDTTIETKEVTRAANVWSFGVLVWEAVCRGQMPYPGLDDDQVIQQVVMDKSCVPDQPTAFQLHQDKLYNIMRQCWAGEDTRPPMLHVLSLLTHLWQHSPHHTASQPSSTTPAPNADTLDDFEVRWKQLQQQQQHCRDHSILHLGNSTDLRFESDFSLSIPGHLGTTVSPSLQNLHGSAEDLDAKMAAKFGSALPSWLGVEPGQPIDSLTQEITDAILKLDDYLAGEKSEPSTAQTSPENGGINFKVGKDSFVSNPPDSKVPRISGLSVEEASGHPSLNRSLSEGEDEGFTMRLEQGEFTEMVRLKSQSVQDFMKLTVVDDGSDSDNTSQRNSLAFEPLTQEKTFISEGNIKEALRDVKFMGELERLQAEHRYSIITEASKEYSSSIEYRMQDVSAESALSQPEVSVESEASSTDKLAASTESVTSSTRGHSEQEPFLGEVISSEQTGESRPNNNNPRDVNNEPHSSKGASHPSTRQKPLPASPDCVVSSREPKPIALPDIVVHNSNMKLSMPSPSPEESPAKIVNKEQPKEFRFVFEGEGDESRKRSEQTGQEASPQCDSVIFSENIKNIEASHFAVSEDGEKERKNYQEMNGKIRSPVSQEPFESTHEKEPQSNGDVHKFRSLFQRESGNVLTSTPFKKLGSTNIVKHGIGEDDNSSPVLCNNVIVSKAGVQDEKMNNSEKMQTMEVDLRTKHRYVFGSSEQKDENNEDEACIIETSDCTDVPDYRPETIVEGEDIVIGALEDYSLDLYRAVKSSDALPPCPGEEESSSEHSQTEGENAGSSSLVMSRACLEREIRRTESEVSGIEFDLEQWDSFLNNTMSADKFGPDSVFQEGVVKVNDDVPVEFEGDQFNSTTKSHKTCEPFNTHEEMNVTDIDSTFEHSTCDEICDIMTRDSKIWSDTLESRPEVNTTMFFSSDSTFDNKKNMSGKYRELIEDEAKEVSSKKDSAEHTPVNERHSVDESFYTAQSVSSELFKTAVADSDLKLVPDTPTTSVDYSDNTLGSEALGSLNSSCAGQDTPSNSFTYRKEGTVDSTFDSLEHVDYVDMEVLSNSTENCDDVAIDNTDAQNLTQSTVGDAMNKDILAAVTENLSRNECDLSVNIFSCSNVNRDLFADATLTDSVNKDLSTFENDDLIVKGNKDSKVSGNSSVDTTHTKTDSGVGEDVGECDSDERPLTIPSHQSPNYRSPTPTSPVYTSPYFVSSDRKSPTHTSREITSSLRLKEENSKIVTEDEDKELVNEEVEEEVENGTFWQQQMVAWQEAAFQTRQLLQEAADGGGKDGEQTQEDVLEASPLSEASSRSHCSSTDILNLDDEGSYVSYNTTDDEEVLGYKPEDINALRAELNRKLGGLSEEQHQEQQQQDLEPEEPDDQVVGDRENVVINYRGILGTTLSPIKEESFLEDEDTPTRKLSVKSSSDLDSVHDPSIEFEEPEEDVTDAQDVDSTFTVTNLVSEHLINTDLLRLGDEVSLDERAKEKTSEIDKGDNKLDIFEETQSTKKTAVDGEKIVENVKIENPHDSLILEDLDDDDGPPSIQIINARSNLDTEDILLVDTETNQATIVDQGRPRSHLAFITDQEEVERTEVQPFMFDETDDVAPESIPSVGGSRFDEMRYREQFLTNNPSWEKPRSIEQREFEGDLESKPATDFLISSLPSGSLESTQHEVPHYHSYFTSGRNTIAHPSVTTFSSLTHPNASIEEPQEPQHISLPYDVNYPAAGEQLHSLEDINGGAVETCTGEETKISEIEDDEEDAVPIKLNLIGRFYSDESEDKDEKDYQSDDERNNKEKIEKDYNSVSESKSDQQKKKMDKIRCEPRPRKSSDSREASLLSDSEDEDDTKLFAPEDASQMTSAQFLASKTYQTNDDDEIEEEIEVEGGYEEDSEEEEERESSPRKAPKDGIGAEGEDVESRDPRYTPDWESDSDSDGESSSTSGEFMWREDEEKEEKSFEGNEKEKPGEPCQPTTYILDVIEEEPEQQAGRRKEIEEEEEEVEGGSGEESESGEEEFTPSQWNSDLTPSHSLLKSPLNKSSLKKRVRWKRQRHHRVYEYPPEPRSWEPGSSFSHSDRRAWQRSSLDYLTLADWELGSDEFIAEDGGDMEDYVYHKPTRPAPPPPIYSLGSMAYDDTGDGFLVDNGEFFIRSSGSPFTFNRSTFSASDFFPGGHTVDYDVLFGTQTQGGRQTEASGIHSNTEQLKLEGEAAADVGEKQVWGEHEKRCEHEREREPTTIKDDKTEKEFAPTPSMRETDNFPTLEELDQGSPTASASLGQLRHTRDKLRLEIPSMSVGGDDLADVENGRPAFPSVSFKRTEPEVSEV